VEFHNSGNKQQKTYAAKPLPKPLKTGVFEVSFFRHLTAKSRFSQETVAKPPSQS
jgi:hypothetical protein